MPYLEVVGSVAAKSPSVEVKYLDSGLLSSRPRARMVWRSAELE